jgi:ribonuclease VapC
MIVDSSALLAILNRELDAERYEAAILTAPRCRMSVANLLETSIVVESRGGAEAGYELDVFLESAEIEPMPVTTEQLAAARQAWRQFGKGRHPAALNFGDCFAYALAQVSGEPLLYKGDDFTRTDVTPAGLPLDGIGGE